MKNTVQKYGMYGFTFAFVSFLAGLYFDITTNIAMGYATIIVSLLFVYFGIKQYRDNYNEGVITFKKAIIIGSLISLFAALGIALADYVFTTFVDPDFLKISAKEMRDRNPSGEIQEFTSVSAAFFMFAVVMLVGLIVSLISALTLKRTHS